MRVSWLRGDPQHEWEVFQGSEKKALGLSGLTKMQKATFTMFCFCNKYSEKVERFSEEGRAGLAYFYICIH
jgi:hypothetical protein